MTRTARHAVPLSGALVLASVLACGGTNVIEEHQSAAQRGRELFSSHEASASRDNAFSCFNCHATRAGETRILTGAPMGNAPERLRYWGGSVLDLLGAINACRITFMDARDPWTDADADAKAMYAYLTSLSSGSGSADAVPFSVVRVIGDVPAGDAERGRDVYQRACQTCHGLARSGEGRLEPSIPRLPDDTLAEHSPAAGYTPATVRLVVIEKIRHGGFLGYGGKMPPYSIEALDDGKVGDVLAYLGF